MSVDMSKAKKNSIVHFHCGGQATIALIKQCGLAFVVRLKEYPNFNKTYSAKGTIYAGQSPMPYDFVSVVDGPFDWDDVKPGMAFKGPEGDVCYYVGPTRDVVFAVVVEWKITNRTSAMSLPRYGHVCKDALTRYPKGDGDIFK